MIDFDKTCFCSPLTGYDCRGKVWMETQQHPLMKFSTYQLFRNFALQTSKSKKQRGKRNAFNRHRVYGSHLTSVSFLPLTFSRGPCFLKFKLPTGRELHRSATWLHRQLSHFIKDRQVHRQARNRWRRWICPCRNSKGCGSCRFPSDQAEGDKLVSRLSSVSWLQPPWRREERGQSLSVRPSPLRTSSPWSVRAR